MSDPDNHPGSPDPQPQSPELQYGYWIHDVGRFVYIPSKLSPLEEGLLVYGLGYYDPLLALRPVAKLLIDVNQSADWVVFHGSSPLIPQAASLFVQQRPKTGPDVLICDDLSGTAPIKTSVIWAVPSCSEKTLWR